MKITFGILVAIQTLCVAGTLEFKSLTKEQSVAADATKVTTDFEFTNKTDKPVTITKCDPTCSCLAVQVAGGKMKYAPGESGVIRTVFDVGNATGPVEKGVAIFLDNDPLDQPSVLLQAKILIPVLVSLEPKTLSWDLGSQPEEKTIRIKMAEGNSIHVVGVELKDSFKYELRTIEKGTSYDLVVSPKSTGASDLGIIRIETDSKIAKQKFQQAFVVLRKPVLVKDVSQK
jgi:hypothetical protein